MWSRQAEQFGSSSESSSEQFGAVREQFGAVREQFAEQFEQFANTTK
jgi:hypothetical protein